MNRFSVLVSILVVVALGAGFFWFRQVEAPVIAPQEGTIAIATTSPEATSTPVSPATPSGASPAVPATPVSYGKVTLALGQTPKVGALTITPTTVAQDSRCPVDVQCIQAGTVEVTLSLAHGGASSKQTVALGKTITTDTETITFVAVSPERTSGTAPASGAYRFTFDIEKKAAVASGPCYVGGCSAQICSDQKDVVSTCEYTAAYGCYKTATCERQPSGQCGWTPSPALTSCLANPPSV